MLTALHRTAKEVESGGTKIIAQSARSVTDDIERKIGFEVVEGGLGKDFFQFVDGLGLIDRHFLHGRNALQQEERAPVDAGIVLDEFKIGHLVVVAFHIAQLGGGVRGLGDARFDGENSLHLLLCRSSIVARHHEELLDVFLVGVADFERGFIIFKIVVTLTEGDASLVDLHQVHLGVLQVGIAADAHKGRHTLAAQLVDEEEVGLLVLNFCHTLEQGLDGREAFAVAAHAVHGEAVESANFLFEGAGCRLLRGHLFDERLEAAAVHFVECVKLPVARELGGEGMGFHPSATSILKEVCARLNGEVHVGFVNTRGQPLGKSRGGCECHHWKKVF